MKLTHRLFLFSQDLFISLFSLKSPSVIHNVEKHTVLKKALFYKQIEGLEGDYLEFGVYEGTSLKGAASYWRKIGSTSMSFYGFDSFQGMKPEEGDKHSFYTSFDFSTDFKVVKKRFKNFPEVKLIPGFFQETLKKGARDRGIKKAAIVMMDCDLYSSAKNSFNFIRPIIQKGTILILDDFYNYLGDKTKGVRAAFEEFAKSAGLKYELMSTYGIGGVVFIVSGVNNKS